MSHGDRVEAMLRRVADTLRHKRVDDPAASEILASLRATLLFRRARLGDDEHPLTLHPARTILILIADCDVRDADTLQAAALLETVHDELTSIVPATRPGARALLEQIPRGDDEDAIERLVVAEARARVLALAERLDYARHLHLLDRTEWAQQGRTRAVYLPVAEREGGVLARRYAWLFSGAARRLAEDLPG